MFVGRVRSWSELSELFLYDCFFSVTDTDFTLHANSLFSPAPSVYAFWSEVVVVVVSSFEGFFFFLQKQKFANKSEADHNKS